MSDEYGPWDEATVAAWHDDDVTSAYETSLRVSRDAERPPDLRRTAEQNANITARELKRRGIG